MNLLQIKQDLTGTLPCDIKSIEFIKSAILELVQFRQLKRSLGGES